MQRRNTGCFTAHATEYLTHLRYNIFNSIVRTMEMMRLAARGKAINASPHLMMMVPGSFNGWINDTMTSSIPITMNTIPAMSMNRLEGIII